MLFATRYTILLFLFCQLRLQGQGPAANWCFGNGNYLTINSTTVNLNANCANTNTRSCASISNSNGALLFYTDGVTAWTANSAVMANGTALTGSTSSQSCLILQKPSAANLYYVFSVQGGTTGAGCSYSIIDMNLAAGAGSVIVKNAVLFSGACQEKIAATKHCNGTDYWIMLAPQNGGLYCYSLTATGISTIPVISTGGGGIGSSPLACMKFSPNGKKLAVAISQFVPNFNAGNLQVLDFDNVTGQAVASFLYNLGPWLGTTWNFRGLEFSPNCRMLFVSYSYSIIQFDLCNAAPSTTFASIAPYDDVSNSDYIIEKGALQLGPDSKIYVARVGQTALGVINNPNVWGNGAVYQPTAVSLGTNVCGHGLPNFESSLFEQMPGGFQYSVTNANCTSFNFSGPDICAGTGYSVIAYNWNFGDPSASSNTSTLSNPLHTYSSPGIFTVSLVVNFGCNKTTTLTQQVIVAQPTISLAGPAVACGPISTSVSISGGSGQYSYTWTPGSFSTANVTNLSTGSYTVLVKDQLSSCFNSTVFNLSSVTLTPGIVTKPTQCFGASNGSATITIQGANGPLSYSWTPGNQTSASITNASAGNYTVVIIDLSSNCAAIATLAINSAPLLSIAMAATSSSYCANQTNTIYCSAFGGKPPYQYSWTNGGTNTSQNYMETLPGNYVYTVAVLDSNNCQTSNTISINYQAYPSLSISNSTFCKHQSYTLSASGANTYTWQPGTIISNSISGSALNTSTFTLTGQLNNCSVTQTLQLTVLNLPSTLVVANSPLCAQQSLSLQAGQAGLSYNWSGPAGFSAFQQSTVITVSSLNNGIYTLAVTNSNGCSNTGTFSVLVRPLPTLTLTPPTQVCAGETLTITAAGANTWYWPGFGTNANTQIVSPSTSGYFQVIGTDQYGCQTTSGINITVNNCNGLILISNEADDQVRPNPSTGKILLTVSDAVLAEVISAQGQLIFTMSLRSGTTEIDLSSYSSGVYYLKLNKPSFQKIVKIILQSEF